MKSYVFIDVSRKQEYIFKHNKLSDNLFNSYIIKAVTEEDKPGLDEKGKKREEIADESANATIRLGASVSLSDFLKKRFPGDFQFVYSGGGNSIIQFASPKAAIRFSKEYSRAVLKHYPDLELYISRVDESEVNTDDDRREMNIRQKLHEKADVLKNKRRAVFRRWTYGIEQIGETGKAVPVPQTGIEAKQAELNAERDERARVNLARTKLYGRLEARLEKEQDEAADGSPQLGVKITTKLQDYKSLTGQKSYIGVISIDGNKMGEMVNWNNSFNELKDFSNTIEQIYVDAVANALQASAVRKCPSGPVSNANNDLSAKKLLITPVVLSGDDICLITEGEYALDAAALIVKEIQRLSEAPRYRQKLKHVLAGQPYLTACAGVAIVKVNYPFFDAVKKAEALCHQAKEAFYRQDFAATASFIDWEIVQGQVMSESAYEKNVGHRKEKEKFHIKPLRIDQEAAIESGIFSYEAFRQLASAIQDSVNSDAADSISRSFLEQIKKVLYSGWTQYSLLFEMNQMEGSQRLEQLVKEVLSAGVTAEWTASGSAKNNLEFNHAAVIERANSAVTYTYVLNNVLEALAFMPGEGDIRDVGKQ